mgnify:CR=1 FL=1
MLKSYREVKHIVAPATIDGGDVMDRAQLEEQAKRLGLGVRWGDEREGECVSPGHGRESRVSGG